jgi:hypothetical protein
MFVFEREGQKGTKRLKTKSKISEKAAEMLLLPLQPSEEKTKILQKVPEILLQILQPSEEKTKILLTMLQHSEEEDKNSRRQLGFILTICWNFWRKFQNYGHMAAG